MTSSETSFHGRASADGCQRPCMSRIQSKSKSMPQRCDSKLRSVPVRITMQSRRPSIRVRSWAIACRDPLNVTRRQLVADAPSTLVVVASWGCVTFLPPFHASSISVPCVAVVGCGKKNECRANMAANMDKYPRQQPSIYAAIPHSIALSPASNFPLH